MSCLKFCLIMNSISSDMFNCFLHGLTWILLPFMSCNVDIVLCEFFAESNATRSCLLHKFPSRPSHLQCCPRVSRLQGFSIDTNFRTCSVHTLLVLVNFVVKDAVYSEINGLFESLFRSSATPWWISDKIVRLQLTLDSPRHASTLDFFMNSWRSGCYFWPFSRGELSCEQFSLSKLHWHPWRRKILGQYGVLRTYESSTLHLTVTSKEFDTVLYFSFVSSYL